MLTSVRCASLQVLQTERSALCAERRRLGLCNAGEPDFHEGGYATSGFVPGRQLGSRGPTCFNHGRWLVDRHRIKQDWWMSLKNRMKDGENSLGGRGRSMNAGSQLYEPEGSTQVHKWLAHGFQALTLSSDIFRISVLFLGFWAASAIISA